MSVILIQPLSLSDEPLSWTMTSFTIGPAMFTVTLSFELSPESRPPSMFLPPSTVLPDVLIPALES